MDLSLPEDGLTLTAGCKVNAYLKIVSRREDGYHELKTLFLPLPAPCDILRIFPGSSGRRMTFSCSLPELSGSDNIVVKAYHRFCEKTGFSPDIHVELEKHIPSGAGLGGGSSDAACLLTFLNGAAGRRALCDEALVTLAAGLGADVPFFLVNQPAWASGIGEVLTPAPDEFSSLMGLTLLLVCPNIHVPTPWAYGEWDKNFLHSSNYSLTEQDHMGIFLGCFRPSRLLNDFEQAVFPAYPAVRDIKETLLVAGASGALMSGSGASVFGLFRSKDKAQRAASGFKATGLTCFVHTL